MKTLRIVLEPQSKIETLHHSQNLFGHIAYRLLDLHGEAFLESFLQEIREGAKHFSVSSIMPEGAVFFPLWDIRYSPEETFDSVIAKQLKKIRYISTSILEELLESEMKGDFLRERIKSGEYEIRKDYLMKKDEYTYEYGLGVDIRYSSEEGKLVNIKSYGFSQKSRFHFFLHTDVKEVESLFAEGTYMSLGKKKNTALNTYRVAVKEEISLPDSEAGILCSKYVPASEDEFDRERSRIKVEHVQSRLENRMARAYDPRVKDAFSALAEGSFIVTGKRVLGTLKKRENASREAAKDVFYNGLAFLYPVGDTT